MGEGGKRYNSKLPLLCSCVLTLAHRQKSSTAARLRPDNLCTGRTPKGKKDKYKAARSA